MRKERLPKRKEPRRKKQKKLKIKLLKRPKLLVLNPKEN
jgi:hypothetical protein